MRLRVSSWEVKQALGSFQEPGGLKAALTRSASSSLGVSEHPEDSPCFVVLHPCPVTGRKDLGAPLRIITSPRPPPAAIQSTSY